jgi:D-tagatose-1,6-bisphosphate aldolase subunit GatZ/KbaZ
VCFEAHSTDYQHPEAYHSLAEMGFAIHKVGPALTFAYRQAIYALDAMLDLIEGNARTVRNVPAVMEELMMATPSNWVSHYHGDAQTVSLLRHYSYADRIRYYWAQPAAQSAVGELIQSIDATDLPAPVWMQFFGNETLARSENLGSQGYGAAKSKVLAEIQVALAPYFFDNIEGAAQ